MKILMTLGFITLVGAPFDVLATDPCPTLPKQPSIIWESQRSSEYLRCEAKSASGERLLTTFSATHPGIPTYGFNFYKLTGATDHTIAWFSDRNEHGDSKPIARAFLRSGIKDLPVMMVWFEFHGAEDFARKAELTAQLEIPR